MDILIAFFVSCQALGALIGAGSSVWAEFAYLAAARDGRIDGAERAHLDVIARGLKFGMLLLLLASLGLVATEYAAGTALAPALTSAYWSFIGLALAITLLAAMLSRGRISFSLGSAAIFTGWWFLAYLALGRLPPLSFGTAIALYVVATGFFYLVLRVARVVALPDKGAVPGA